MIMSRQIAITKTRWRLAVGLVILLLVLVVAEAMLLGDILHASSDARSVLLARWHGVLPWTDRAAAVVSGNSLPGERSVFLDDDVRRMHGHIDRMFEEAMLRMERQMQSAMNISAPLPSNRPGVFGPADQIRYLQRDIDSLFRKTLQDQARFAMAHGFHRPWHGMTVSSHVDLEDNGDYYTVRLDLRGAENLTPQISVEGRLLSIVVESESSAAGSWDSRGYETRLMLPGPVDAGSIETEFADGVLQVKIFKAPEPGSKKIVVKTGVDS